MRLAARVIALCFLVFLSIAASADTLTGKVVKVTDGDTITVLDNNIQHRIRLRIACHHGGGHEKQLVDS